VQMRADLCRVWLLEAECSGDTAGVISAYEGFLKNYPESIYKDHINERISALDAEDAKEFYAWFDSQNPKPSGLASALPLDGQQGLPSGHPTAPVTLPRIPEALFPSDWDELKLETLPEPGEAEGESKPTSDSAESGKEPGAAGTDESDSESDSGSDKAAVPESESSDGTESN